MSHPLCVRCQCELSPETNGTTVIEMASFGPYRVWEADTWKCRGCGVEVVTGFGQRPIREDHYTDDFGPWLASYISQARRVVYNHETPQPRED